MNDFGYGQHSFHYRFTIYFILFLSVLAFLLYRFCYIYNNISIYNYVFILLLINMILIYTNLHIFNYRYSTLIYVNYLQIEGNLL